MKKSLLTLLCIAFSSVLFAQTPINSDWAKVKHNDKSSFTAAQYLSEENNSNNSSNASNASSKSGGGSYNTGIGLRFGDWESGITIKHFMNSGAAIEGIISSGWRHRGTRITALYEVQKTLGNSNGLYWFWGVGGHVGFYNESYWYKGDCKNGYYEYKGRMYSCDGTRTTLGIDGILGLEYVFDAIPFSIGVDIKPSIDLMGAGDHYGDLALSIRYVF